MKADIHSFESLAALDGDGLRCAVFFTSCPLRCVYCHNPDTWHKSGREMTPQQLADKVTRFKPYFKNGGGVTFSGGEPLLNAEFINQTAEILKQREINYALDTSGGVPLTQSVMTALDGAELVILDVKFYDAPSYERYTSGCFENFVRIGKYCSRRGIRLWLRTVVVPGINDSEESIAAYADFAGQFSFEKYELLAFHTMGFYKYEKLGIENPLADTPALDSSRLAELQKFLDNRIAKTTKKIIN